MNFDFKGQTVLITGATRGIGESIARALRQLGARLILTGTNAEQVAGLQKSAGDNEIFLHGDFSDMAGIKAFLAQLERFDRIDVCINNAGLNRINPIDQTDPEDWELVRSVNLDAPLLITRHVSGLMRKNGYGRIVNISSIFGVISRAERALYSATKFGLRGLTVASALDLAEAGVLVNAVGPGFVRTDLTVRMLGELEMDRLAGVIPMQRLAEPQEIANVVIFLASRLNTYLTAQTIIVDGGYTAV